MLTIIIINIVILVLSAKLTLHLFHALTFIKLLETKENIENAFEVENNIFFI